MSIITYIVTINRMILSAIDQKITNHIKKIPYGRGFYSFCYDESIFGGCTKPHYKPL